MFENIVLIFILIWLVCIILAMLAGIGFVMLDVFYNKDGVLHVAFFTFYWWSDVRGLVKPSLFNYETGIEDQPYTKKLWLFFVPLSW
ncbi:MAG: hypothetical protein KAJ07_04615 [Planctomycetes bacterium]|nr:hypothetical protein [Planctomycetota bacterium]